MIAQSYWCSVWHKMWGGEGKGLLPSSSFCHSPPSLLSTLPPPPIFPIPNSIFHLYRLKPMEVRVTIQSHKAGWVERLSDAKTHLQLPPKLIRGESWHLIFSDVPKNRHLLTLQFALRRLFSHLLAPCICWDELGNTKYQYFGRTSGIIQVLNPKLCFYLRWSKNATASASNCPPPTLPPTQLVFLSL